MQASFEWRQRILDPAEFREGHAKVVVDIGVVQHAVHGFQARQGVFDEAGMQQPQQIFLGCDAGFGNADHTHHAINHRHCRSPAFDCIPKRNSGDDLLRVRILRHSATGEIGERFLVNLGGLGAGHCFFQLLNLVILAAIRTRVARCVSAAHDRGLQ